jgi:hypothetical protein
MVPTRTAALPLPEDGGRAKVEGIMIRRWSFRAWPQADRAELLDVLAATADERARALPPDRAAALMRNVALQRAQVTGAGLRPLCELVAAAAVVDVHSLGDREHLLRLVEVSLRNGRLLVVLDPFRAPQAEASVDLPKAEIPWDLEVKPLDWIEIRVVDESGAAVGGVEYVLLGPDGQARRGRTDDKGCARFQSVERGSYSVRFPGLDTAAIESA